MPTEPKLTVIRIPQVGGPWYVGECSCGYETPGGYGFPGYADRDVRQHGRDKHGLTSPAVRMITGGSRA